MDKIHISGMKFYGYHGVFPEENRLGQTFLVDLTLVLNLRPAGKSDDIQDSIDYGEIYQATKKIVEGEAKNLIEAVAEEIAAELLRRYKKISALHVKVTKPNPPIPGAYDGVAVEIYRERLS